VLAVTVQGSGSGFLQTEVAVTTREGQQVPSGRRLQQPATEEVMFWARGKQVVIAVGSMVSC
jgi:coproporphyrinogen III oxidase